MPVGACGTAEVTASAPGTGIVEDQFVTVDAHARKVSDTVRRPQSSWNPEHTYSGKTANLYMDAQSTGCFCGAGRRGSVEHTHIVYVQPGRIIRMTGGLGPLQAEAVNATLAFKLDWKGRATKVTMTYVVGGYMRQGGETLAPLVDRVLGDQLKRLKAAARRRHRPRPNSSAE